MSLPLIKYHLEELQKLLIQQQNNFAFAKLYAETDILLNSPSLKNITTEPAGQQPGKFVPVEEHAKLRKRAQTAEQCLTEHKQIVENLIKQIQESPDCSEKMKIRIVEVQKEMAQRIGKPTQDSRQKATAEGQ